LCCVFVCVGGGVGWVVCVGGLGGVVGGDVGVSVLAWGVCGWWFCGWFVFVCLCVCVVCFGVFWFCVCVCLCVCVCVCVGMWCTCTVIGACACMKHTSRVNDDFITAAAGVILHTYTVSSLSGHAHTYKFPANMLKPFTSTPSGLPSSGS